MRHGSQPTANRPPHLVASYDTQGGAEDVFYPDVPTGLMHSELVAENISCIEYMGGEWANYIIYIIFILIIDIFR